MNTKNTSYVGNPALDGELAARCDEEMRARGNVTTAQNAAAKAIAALAHSIYADSVEVSRLAYEASNAAHHGNQNLTVGTLMPAREKLAAMLAQYDAIIALHRPR